ncbi:tail sheath protein [Pseudomonas phage vB_PseuGesM_254]|uniref:Tail sheath protein n=1 Tax=Pseudomonas phage vB_PseuGesM_254 TaxID=3092638 RepID=A0AAX4G7X9_9CAUD|nr:tail sheath protein [Pseudomonas phage PseuGes_254]
MTRLTDIIEINISRETTAVAQTNFNVPLFLSAHTNFMERAREYTSIEAVATDFATTSPTYVAATRLFSQQIKPRTIVVGRRQVPTVTVNVTTVSNSATYTVTVNSLVVTYTTPSADATAASIAAGLATAYNATPVTGITLVDNLDGTITFTSTIDWALTVTTNLAKSNGPSTESWGEAIEAVQRVNDTWYALTAETHKKEDILAIAAVIEAKKKIYGTSSSDSAIKTSATDDVMSELKSRSYMRTFLLFSETADADYPECAWIGYQLQETPGSNTWAFKVLSGPAVSRLNDTESGNVIRKNGNTYETVGGVNRTVQAKMAGGEWIDVMVFVDWLESRMRERIWFRLANSKKIPYTQAGATIIETEVRAQLREGIRNGGLADSPAPRVTVPDVLTIAPNLRAQRIFEGIEFEARLAGAIHFVKIVGTVTV